MIDATKKGHPAASISWRRKSPKPLLATLLLVLITAATANARGEAPSPRPHRLSVGILPLMISNFDGRYGLLFREHGPDAAKFGGGVSLGSIGFATEYAYRVTGHVELGGVFWYRWPLQNMTYPDGIHDLCWCARVTRVFSLLDGSLDLALAGEAGMTTIVYNTRGLTTASTGGLIGLVFSARPWLSDRFGLFLELASNFAAVPKNDDDFWAIGLRWLTGNIGGSLRF